MEKSVQSTIEQVSCYLLILLIFAKRTEKKRLYCSETTWLYNCNRLGYRNSIIHVPPFGIMHLILKLVLLD